MLNKSAVASALALGLTQSIENEIDNKPRVIYKGNDIKDSVDTSSYNSYAKKQRKNKRRK